MIPNLIDLLPRYFKENDSYKHSDGRGFLERFLANLRISLILLESHIKEIFTLSFFKKVDPEYKKGIEFFGDWPFEDKIQKGITPQYGKYGYFNNPKITNSESTIRFGYLTEFLKRRGTLDFIKALGKVYNIDLGYNDSTSFYPRDIHVYTPNIRNLTGTKGIYNVPTYLDLSTLDKGNYDNHFEGVTAKTLYISIGSLTDEDTPVYKEEAPDGKEVSLSSHPIFTLNSLNPDYRDRIYTFQKILNRYSPVGVKYILGFHNYCSFQLYTNKFVTSLPTHRPEPLGVGFNIDLDWYLTYWTQGIAHRVKLTQLESRRFFGDYSRYTVPIPLLRDGVNEELTLKFEVMVRIEGSTWNNENNRVNQEALTRELIDTFGPFQYYFTDYPDNDRAIWDGQTEVQHDYNGCRFIPIYGTIAGYSESFGGYPKPSRIQQDGLIHISQAGTYVFGFRHPYFQAHTSTTSHGFIFQIQRDVLVIEYIFQIVKALVGDKDVTNSKNSYLLDLGKDESLTLLIQSYKSQGYQNKTITALPFKCMELGTTYQSQVIKEGSSYNTTPYVWNCNKPGIYTFIQENSNKPSIIIQIQENSKLTVLDISADVPGDGYDVSYEMNIYYIPIYTHTEGGSNQFISAFDMFTDRPVYDEETKTSSITGIYYLGRLRVEYDSSPQSLNKWVWEPNSKSNTDAIVNISVTGRYEEDDSTVEGLKYYLSSYPPKLINCGDPYPITWANQGLGNYFVNGIIHSLVDFTSSYTFIAKGDNLKPAYLDGDRETFDIRFKYSQSYEDLSYWAKSNNFGLWDE